MPLISREPLSGAVRGFLEDTEMVVWWATRVECVSAISRRAREGSLDAEGERAIRDLLNDLSGSWTEVLPSARLRDLAVQNLVAHPLRAADALQLASALIWCGSQPKGHGFVSLDVRLRTAASRSGFTLLPDSMG